MRNSFKAYLLRKDVDLFSFLIAVPAEADKSDVVAEVTEKLEELKVEDKAEDAEKKEESSPEAKTETATTEE